VSFDKYKSRVTKHELNFKKQRTFEGRGDDRQPMFDVTFTLLGWVFKFQHMLYLKQCLEHKKIKVCNKWHFVEN
jgi:hypothetical protein